MRHIRAFSAMTLLQQRFILGFALLFLLLLFLLLTQIFMRSYVPLYGVLNPNQMVRVIEQLNKDEVDYRIHDSNIIVVPKPYLLQERERMVSLGIAGDVMPKEARVSYASSLNRSEGIVLLVYSVIIAIGLLFLWSIWKQVWYSTQYLKRFKTDGNKRNLEASLPKSAEGLNELQVPVFSGYDALTTALEKRIDLRKDDVAVLIEALLHNGFKTKVTKAYQLDTELQSQYLQLNRAEKIAFVLGQLDVGITASVFKLLGPERMKEIALIISEGITVDKKIARVLLEEFVLLIQSNPYVKSGSYAYVKKVLYAAFEEAEAQEIEHGLTMMAERNELFSWLAAIRPERLATELANEHPQTVSLILAHFDEEMTAGVLKHFSAPLAQEILQRIQTLTTVPSNVIEPLMEGLKSKFKRGGMERCIGGKAYVQKVYSVMDIESDSLRSSHTSEKKQRTFEEIRSLGDDTIRVLLKLTGKRELMYALKGASEELQEHFFANMSLTVSKMLRQRMKHLQKITVKEINDAQEQILKRVWNLDEE